MNRVYLGIGSNIDREQHVTAALDALQKQFGQLVISSVYESEAVGFAGDHFLNLVVGIDTAMTVAELSVCLRRIEHDNGRARSSERFAARTLDIDILTYGSASGKIDGIQLPRDEILKNAFVLLPLSEIAAEELHPTEKQSYAALWRAYSKEQKLWAIDFSWRDNKISSEPVL